MADKLMLLVGSKVKQVIKEKDMMCSAEVLDEVNDCVHECLDRAAERAKENGRKTVQARDV
ncbi:MAG: DUF1931 domain-containing protein [Planctomycetota bacterium]